MQTPPIHRIIREILLENHYVVVPGLGGFVTNYQAAFIDEKKQIILPPNRRISFNADLVDDDGMLVNKLAQREGISFKASKQIIENWVKKGFDILDNGKRIQIERIGVLSYNENLKLEFTPEKPESFSLHAYGLVSVECQRLNKQELIQQDKKRFFNRKTLLRAAALIPLFLIGFVLSFYLSNNSLSSDNEQALSSVISWDFSKQETSSPKTEVENPVEKIINDKTKQENALLYSEDAKELTKTLKTEPVKKSTEVKPEPKAEPKVESKKSVKKQKNYWLVAGSFGSKLNADKKVRQLKRKSRPAFVVKSGSNYRVIVETFETKSEAQKVRRILKSKKISTWIYTKK